MHTYAIRFDFPEGTAYAGMFKGAAGFSPTLSTALMFNDAERARTMLNNAYGAAGDWGRVIEVDGIKVA